MSKKLLPILLIILIVFISGCGAKDLSVDRGDEPSVPEITSSETVPEPEPELFVNPLTGIKNLSAEKADDRPVAITVNNISNAQTVQTGLNLADVVYETEVEGGITRLVAIYQNISAAEKVGTVRSARYAFIDLAMGHNAIYIYHGQDSKYAAPHLKDVAHMTLDTNNAGVRISNGQSREHTLYAYGDLLWKTLVNKGFKTENTSVKTWQTFAAEDAPVTLSGTAVSVTVPFSASYKTIFKYDAATGKYLRFFNNTQRKDYITGEAVTFKNVFVLTTTITNYTDNYHRKIYLDSGDGYYFVNGTYTPIKWSKGSSANGFVFTNTDGTPLTVNPGNSWVCIANKSTSKPTIQ